MMFLVSEVQPFADCNGRIARVMMNAALAAAQQVRVLIEQCNARALAAAHKSRAERLLAPIDQRRTDLPRHETYMLERSERDKDQARRWMALAKVMLQGSS